MSVHERERPITPLPRRFPTWPGLLLGLIVTGALVGAGVALPLDLPGSVVGPLALAHGLAVLAIVTLIGEAIRVLGWDRELQACRSSADSRRGGWPIDAVDDACRRLPRRHSTQEQRVELSRTGDLIVERQAWVWRLAIIIAFLIPAIGFAASLWELRIERNTIPYREIALPLLVALAEVLPILLPAFGIRGLVRSLIQQWKLLAEEVCGLRKPEGGIDVSPESAFEPEFAPVDIVDNRPAPAPYSYPNSNPNPPPRRPAATTDDGGWPEEFNEPPARPRSEPEPRPGADPPRESSSAKPKPEAPRKPRSNRPEDYY